MDCLKPETNIISAFNNKYATTGNFHEKWDPEKMFWKKVLKVIYSERNLPTNPQQLLSGSLRNKLFDCDKLVVHLLP